LNNIIKIHIIKFIYKLLLYIYEPYFALHCDPDRSWELLLTDSFEFNGLTELLFVYNDLLIVSLSFLSELYILIDLEFNLLLLDIIGASMVDSSCKISLRSSVVLSLLDFLLS